MYNLSTQANTIAHRIGFPRNTTVGEYLSNSEVDVNEKIRFIRMIRMKASNLNKSTSYDLKNVISTILNKAMHELKERRKKWLTNDGLEKMLGKL